MTESDMPIIFRVHDYKGGTFPEKLCFVCAVRYAMSVNQPFKRITAEVPYDTKDVHFCYECSEAIY
jgi:hypothetical protein